MKVLLISDRDYDDLQAALERYYNYACLQVHLCRAFKETEGVHWYARAYWRLRRRKYWRLLQATQ
jgi:hypothetical protein